MNAELWASAAIAIGTLLFVVVPTVVYAYCALEEWIDDRNSYDRVIRVVEHR